MNPDEKIQLDDITFDDVILGDGLETAALDPIEKPTEEVSDELSEEISKENIEEEEEIVEPKAKKLEKKEDKIEEESPEEDEDEDSEEGPGSVVNEVLEKLGFEIGDSNYKDTPEGLANLTEDVAAQLADEKVDDMLGKFPLVKQHLEYVMNGGESQSFMQAYDPSLDYEKIELQEEDVRSQKAILGDYFAVKGHDQEFIKEILEDYEDNGKLHNKAVQAKVALAKVQGQQREQLMSKQQEEVKEQQNNIKVYWEGVANTLETSKDFGGLSIPDREKGKFYSYLSAPVNNDGSTQRDLDHGKAPMETKLAIDYLMYKGFNLEQIINTKATTKATKSLREKISRNEEKTKSSRAQTRRKKSNVDFNDLDLSNI